MRRPGQTLEGPVLSVLTEVVVGDPDDPDVFKRGYKGREPLVCVTVNAYVDPAESV